MRDHDGLRLDQRGIPEGIQTEGMMSCTCSTVGMQCVTILHSVNCTLHRVDCALESR